VVDFSIESASDRIQDTRTAEYFREVRSSYENGNFRSAVVMLWAVVICDLLFKLDELKSLYGDPVATKILEEVEASQKKNPRSPAWEEELLGKVQARTSLLDLPEVTGLRQLLEHRHYSAHPVMTSGYTLYAPTRESARAHIRTALEAVLTKPSIMVRKIHDSLLEDLEARSALFPDDEELRRFLEAKYFAKMLPPVQDATFTSLWRVAFKSQDKRAEDSRPIIFRALRLLYVRAPDRFRDLISKSRVGSHEVGTLS